MFGYLLLLTVTHCHSPSLTVSLDEANKAGLAHALTKIILNRHKQQNFQLICITHDVDFVRLISDELERWLFRRSIRCLLT